MEGQLFSNKNGIIYIIAETECGFCSYCNGLPAYISPLLFWEITTSEHKCFIIWQQAISSSVINIPNYSQQVVFYISTSDVCLAHSYFSLFHLFQLWKTFFFQFQICWKHCDKWEWKTMAQFSCQTYLLSKSTVHYRHLKPSGPLLSSFEATLLKSFVLVFFSFSHVSLTRLLSNLRLP